MSNVIEIIEYFGYTNKGKFVPLTRDELDEFFKKQKELEKMIVEETDATKKSSLEATRLTYIHQVWLRLTDRTLKMSARSFMHQLMVLHPTLGQAKWSIKNIAAFSSGAEVEILETKFEKGDLIPPEWGYKEGEVFNEDFIQQTITKFQSIEFEAELDEDIKFIKEKDRRERRKRLQLLDDEPKTDAE